MQREHDVEVSWLMFPLHPEIPQGGVTIEELFGGPRERFEPMRQRLRDLAREQELPFGEIDRIPNTRLAQQLAKWAETQPGGIAVHDALFRAYFVDGQDIGEAEVLAQVAGSVGLDAERALRSLHEPSSEAAVDADWRRAREIGVTAVPTFLAGEATVVGAQPYTALEQLVTRSQT